MSFLLYNIYFRFQLLTNFINYSSYIPHNFLFRSSFLICYETANSDYIEYNALQYIFVFNFCDQTCFSERVYQNEMLLNKH